jgi:hypothetical protein
MSSPGNALGSGALDLPPFSLDVEVLHLGSDVKAVGLELLETESREPVRGTKAAQIWSAAFPALAGEEFLRPGFFSHLDRVRDFCSTREIPFRDAAERCLVISSPHKRSSSILLPLRIETFGMRVGPQPRNSIPPSKASSPNADSTPINPPIRATHFAPFVNPKTAGSRCSAKHCGRAK